MFLVSFIDKSYGQNSIDSFTIYGDVKVTIDKVLNDSMQTIIILYALPNGNTTEQTMGKKLQANDDWHFDIQHIKAQTAFLREKLKKKNIAVVYLENGFRSWPLWKQKHTAYQQMIPHIVDTIFSSFGSNHNLIYLNGHSGGGSFVFGYIEGIKEIPSYISRINFLDSNYGYDNSYYPKFKKWLGLKNTCLTVFAYNDSVALYNDKPVVSEKGGTWYRSHLMLQHLQKDFKFEKVKNNSLMFLQTKNKKIGFFLKDNLERKIFHTQQVELNGFIHSILYGTEKENEGYEYFGRRAYSKFIVSLSAQ